MNQVAAVPSLHTAFAVLTCLVLLPVARRLWQRVALVAYALLMPLVLVWAGEHYVVDTLLGAGVRGRRRPPRRRGGRRALARLTARAYRDRVTDVPDWLTAARRICVLTGAGISTDSGIPDYRGPERRVDDATRRPRSS